MELVINWTRGLVAESRRNSLRADYNPTLPIAPGSRLFSLLVSRLPCKAPCQSKNAIAAVAVLFASPVSHDDRAGQLDDAVSRHAKPEIDEGPPVDQPAMTRAGWKPGREADIENVAKDDCGEIFDPATIF